MTSGRALNILLIGGAAMLLAAVFALYQSPLMEIYLASWSIC